VFSIIIELKDVSFSYGQESPVHGLREINLTIRQGEVVLLCGESGCGKTTLTRLVNGLIPHYYEGKLTGEVLINGQSVRQLPLYETAKMVGSVFQNPRSQFFNVDTTSELAFACENMGLPAAEIRRRIAATVAELKIEALLDRSIFQLSGGEKQKIACASVSAGHPDIFVLDEPSSNLDTTTIEDLRRLIALWKNQGKTILIAEHRLYFLRDLVDRVLYMVNGRIAAELTQGQLRALTKAELSRMGLRPLVLQSLTREGKKPGALRTEDLCLSNLEFSYRNQALALKIGTLTVPRGGIIAVIGDNGAGKSTFARCLCGLEKGCKATLSAGGKTWKRGGRLKQCYLVMQDVNHQLFTESVLDEILLSMAEPDPAKVESILDSLDLLPLKDRHPMALSGGQKQRVAIAGAVAAGREIIVFDEPTSGLDLRHMQKVAHNLLKLRQMGKTLFVISHDLELILECCTHVLHLVNGGVVGNYPLDSQGVAKLRTFFVREN
jgi:energy-coupling factor transporter ATP-binding protein EcfA2